MSSPALDVLQKAIEPQKTSGSAIEAMADKAADASQFLKALSHEGRLLIMCHLLDGEKSVNTLEDLLDLRQAAVSQQLARLRHEGMVRARRDGKTIYYSIADPRVEQVLTVMHDIFCPEL